MHMAAVASCDPLADAAFAFPAAMAYRSSHHPCNGSGGSAAASAFYCSPAAAFLQPALFGGGAAPQQQQLDVFEYLSDEGVPAAAVPGTFGTPPPPSPPRTPAERVVPDAAGYGRARSATAAVGGEGARRTERIAFRVRSEEEVLDDGYRWRKYGKKSVKNSPNPRNYYRCSTEGCNVKKRVERDKDDQSYVVTMYEGVHNHVSPGTIYYAAQDATSGRFFVAGMHQLGR